MFDQVKDYIKTGDTQKALGQLEAAVRQEGYLEYQNDVILLAGKYSSWQKGNILGISDSNSNEGNRINYSILQLISLIEFEKSKRSNNSNGLIGYILVGYWSNAKGKNDYTVNDEENENIADLAELQPGRKYIVKYSYGANLRAYLPPKEGYSNQAIKETKLIRNLKQCTQVRILEPLYQYSEDDYWAKVQVVEEER